LIGCRDGGGGIMADLLAGRIDYMCDVLSTAEPQIADRQGDRRVQSRGAPVLPDVPTAHERWLNKFEAAGWFAMFAPKQTPVADIMMD
jgi:tripartite-type tricarboxylate transporter receptor subunit TctC